MFTLDFETEAIVGNPIMAAPKPVGLAFKNHSFDPTYVTEMDDMFTHLRMAWESGEPLLFHNSRFDIEVAKQWFAMWEPDWERVHDTQYLVYLHDPHAPNLSLKPSAERILGWDVGAKDELQEWVLANIRKAGKRNWGAYISEAPHELVAKYAKQDVEMTHALYRRLYEAVPREAYDRERRLAPYLASATQHGIRVAQGRLQHGLDATVSAHTAVLERIRANLQAPSLNPHSGAELAEALDKRGLVKEWKYTPTGRKSTKRENLMAGVTDPALLELLVYASACQTVIGTFMEPWLDKCSQTGRLHPNWNQVRSHEGRGKGTRTGRLSSDDPNFQNVPNSFAIRAPAGLPPLPNLREYLLPEEGCVWVSADFSSQEMRILAHYEKGQLMEALIANPDLDPHAMVQALILNLTGKQLTRKQTKIISFGIMYGMGVGKLAQDLGVEVDSAQAMIRAYMKALPGVEKLQDGTKRKGQIGHGILTWGGRRYYAEEPKLIHGRYRSYEYKLLNYLIQGSAADQTKEVMIDWFEHQGPGEEFLCTVHDEINISVPVDKIYRGTGVLSECMNADHFRVPMRSTIEAGPSWGLAK